MFLLYKAMRAYFFASGMQELREGMLRDAGLPVDADIADEAVYLQLVWPYHAKRFAPLVDLDAWRSIPATVHHGFDDTGHLVTLTLFTHFQLAAVVAAGKGEMWLEAGRYCNTYTDIMTHGLCIKHNRMIARRVSLSRRACTCTCACACAAHAVRARACM
jgi:hypothetical protein